MLHLRQFALCLSAALLFALPTAAQIPQNEGEVNLSATETCAVLAPAATPSTLIPFQDDVEGREDDGYGVKEVPTSSFQFNDSLVTINSSKLAPRFIALPDRKDNHASLANDQVGTSINNTSRAVQPVK